MRSHSCRSDLHRQALVPAVNVTAAGFSLEAGKDYTAAYTKNKYTGKAAVTVTGTGNFTGTATKTFRIVPARAKIKSIKAGKGNFTVEVRSQAKSKASGYQVTYKKKGSSKWKSVKTRSVKKTVNNLKRWRYFTVKARAYKKISGEVVYGKYSAARKYHQITYTYRKHYFGNIISEGGSYDPPSVFLRTQCITVWITTIICLDIY